ncbi:hypothetical protein HPO96_30160 [Kribbella sandramycini]|uniref:Uncharacterized protein n=1 Tax=Kribbella sandramycini TaxID=60450 RepID=A0A7Y4L573_9ACTN|nr:hypothetical protein [Kribbella sandramycini]MBB6566795.1 hypothetical protein [Kribbella sandramycini]NOL44518.1 hypothetical protein [Kribbella sandramycini]
MKKPKPDISGIIAGTVLSGGATIWFLNEQGVLQTKDLGLTGALLLLAAGAVGLAAAHRG